MPLRYRRRILDHLARDSGRWATAHDLAKSFRVGYDQMDVLQGAIAGLIRDEVLVADGDRLQLPKIGPEVEGVYRGTRRGFGFVQPDSPTREGDVFIPNGAQGSAVSGDRVRCTVSGRGARKGRGPSGRVDEVLERCTSTFAGTVTKQGRTWLVEPDGRKLRECVVIRDPGAKNIKPGDKVVFELVAWPEDDMLPEGVITEVLGKSGEPHAETEAVIAAHGIRTEFPEAALEEARAAATLIDGTLDDRLDLRDHVTFTIDPPDARDFDDAISVVWDADAAEWELMVHIADVGFFVPAGGPLDEEAKARGNSTYLPRRVIPMLPEVLSNGVCSLQEGVDRCAKTIIIRIDERGRVGTVRSRSTLINSDKRFTYIEAQAWIDGDTKSARKQARTGTSPTDAVLESLRATEQLAKAIQGRRRRDGMITLNLPESELQFDDEGRVFDVQPEDDAYTHTLIEMLMVEANEAVARVFDTLDVPMIRRIHAEPELESLDDLRTLAMAAGHRLPESPTRKDLQQLLDATKDSDSARAVHFAVLRTLTRAEYSPAVIGHFALASKHYAHFTSPIRRYPDLVLHRALGVYLEHIENGQAQFSGRRRRELERLMHDDDRLPSEVDLIELGKHCSDTERESEQAERELREFLVLQFLETHHLGDDVTAAVSRFTSSGVLVSLDRFLVTGMISWQDMGGGRRDHWEELTGMGRIVGRGSGAVLAIGDQVTVRVTRVDSAERFLELMLVNRPDRTTRDLPLPSKRRIERDRKRASRGGGRKGGGKSNRRRRQ